MFQIDESCFDKFTQVKALDTTSGEYVTIIPEYGGKINELVLNKNEKNYSILYGSTNYSDFMTSIGKTFQGAKLIPFPNRINNGHYYFKGIKYQLPINEPEKHHSIHGFLFDKKMNILEKKVHDDRVLITMEYIYEGDMTGYPFIFELQIVYCLDSDNGFKCTTKITNIDKKSIPVGDGWHPYFKTEGKVDDLMLELPSSKKVEIDANMIPTGKMEIFRKFSTPSKIGNMEFDTTLYLGDKEGRNSTFIYDTRNDLKINIWQETGKGKYNYLQIFIPPNRESIAIEPMTCNINAFNNNDGLIVLEPGESFLASYGVSIMGKTMLNDYNNNSNNINKHMCMN